jgi:hypothetical protein
MARLPTIPSLLLPYLSGLPPGALSRICVEVERFSDWDLSVWSQLCALGLSLDVLVMSRTPFSESFDLTFPNVHEIRVMIPSRTLDHLEWFGHFWDRHPHISRVTISWWMATSHSPWEAFKNVPPVRALYDAAHRQGLASSFDVLRFVGNRRQSPPYPLGTYSLDIHIGHHDVVPDIIELVGSAMPTPHLTIHSRPQVTHPCLCDAVSHQVDYSVGRSD